MEGHVLHGLKARVRILLERVAEDAVQRGRQRAYRRRQLRGLVAGDGAHGLGRGFALERPLAGDLIRSEPCSQTRFHTGTSIAEIGSAYMYMPPLTSSTWPVM
jgi:hypothetical protein